MQKPKVQIKDTKSQTLSDEGIDSSASRETFEIDINYWPFADLDLDVVGSPELSRLVEALELETYGDVPPLDLPPPVLPPGKDLLSSEELQVVPLGQHQGNMNSETKNPSNMYNLGKLVRGAALKLPARNTWDNQSNLFIPLSAIYRHPSPFNEVDPFPAAASASHPLYRWQIGSQSGIGAYVESLNTIVANLYPEEDSRWPEMMKLQADSYFSTKLFSQAEELYRKLLACYEKTIGLDSVLALDVSRKIAMALFHQGKYQQADKFYQPVHATVMAQFSGEHFVVQDSISTKSAIASFTGDFNEEAYLLRQLAQIDLCHRGPRHRNTIESLRRLAIALQNTGYQVQSEKLLYTVIQLFHKNMSQWQHTDKEQYGRAFQNLCRTLYVQERYEVCEEVCQHARQQVKSLLGPNHDITLCLDFRLATIWKKRGIRYAECEMLLRETLQRQRVLYSAFNAATVDSIQELAELLTTLGRHNEASEFYEQAFWNDLDTYGPDHNYTLDSFLELGTSYECEGRRDDTLLLAREYIKQIGELKGKDDPAIIKVQKWLDERPEQLL